MLLCRHGAPVAECVWGRCAHHQHRFDNDYNCQCGAQLLPGLRNLFCATEGRVLLDVDYQRLEAIILAFLSQDEALLSWLKSGIDIHIHTARMLFNLGPDDYATPKQRELAKRLRYGMHYGVKAPKAWSTLHVDYPDLSLTQVRAVLDKLAAIHPGITSFHQSQLQFAMKHGYIEEPFGGNRYYFYGNVEPNKVYNLPIQMFAAWLINQAMKRISRRLDWKNHDAILAQVHDSLIAESDRVVYLYRVIVEEMQRPVSMTGSQEVSFLVDVAAGLDWGECETIKESAMTIDEGEAQLVSLLPKLEAKRERTALAAKPDDSRRRCKSCQEVKLITEYPFKTKRAKKRDRVCAVCKSIHSVEVEARKDMRKLWKSRELSFKN